jgi:DNA mismatch repair ATPase MutS
MNESAVIKTIEYLDTLSELISKEPVYAPFRKVLNRFYSESPWLEQMRSLAENSTKYSKYQIKAKLEFAQDYSYEKEKNFKFKSVNYLINFVSNDTVVPMYNRMSGRVRLTKDKNKILAGYLDVSQRTNTVDDRTLENLVKKVIAGVGVRQLWDLGKEEKVYLDLEINVNSNSGKTTAIAKFNNGRMQKLFYVEKKDYSNFEWLNAKENYSVRNKVGAPGFASKLRSIKDAHLFIGSRMFIYSYIDDFKDLFFQLDELVLLSAVANFYSENKGKWTIPKMLPTTSMSTKIVQGINPLFLKKNQGITIPNDAVFSKHTNGFLITGANTGGKTGYTNMVAMNQMLAQAGWPVFAESAILSVKDKILCHYVESEDIGVNLSRYQSELHRLRDIVGQMTSYSLVIFDEPFSGTSFESGTFQAYEVLKVMAKVKCSFIMNTHFHQLISKVGSNGTSSIKQIHFLLPDSNQPKTTDYKVQPGGINISHGEALALTEKVDFRSMMKDLKKRKVVNSIR